MRLIFKVTATTKHSSRWLLPAAGGVGGRTGLSDSFVHSFIKYILGALARASVPGPGDQCGTLRPWLGAPSEPERAGFCARAHLLLASVLCDLWWVGLQFVNGGVESITPASLFSVTSSRWPDGHRLAFGTGLVSREIPAGLEVGPPRK